jgi:3-oxoacyl-[acyl-carrier protein] reductase
MVQGKVCIITGGAMGLGREFGIELTDAGAKVVIADMDEENGLAFVQELKQSGKEAFYVNVNVLKEDSVKQMVQKTLDHFGTVDILVNSAGVTKGTPLEEIGTEEWDFVLNVNLRGSFLCSKYVLPIMKRQRYGRIVNISSVAAVMGGGFVGTSHYAASKAGVMGLTVAAAREYATDGITVNAIAPGPCRTRMAAGKEEMLGKVVPAGRLGEPEDIANAVLFLASERSGYITGQTLAVDGGLTSIGKVVS